MKIATPDRCLFGNTPELHLIAHTYSLNVAVFQANPDNPQEYMLTQSIVVDPNNHDNVIYLLHDGNHYQRIITLDGHYFIDTTSAVPPFNHIQKYQELPSNLPQLLPLPVVH